MIQLPWKKIALWSWVVLMTLYFIWSIWNNTLLATYNAGRQTGAQETVVSLIEQASDKKCQPFNVYAGESKVDLINVACLKQAPAETPKKK